MLSRWISKLGSKGQPPKEGSGKVSIAPWSPAAQFVLTQATREARDCGGQPVAPDHLLMAITQIEVGLAGKVLAGLGVNLGDLYASVAKEYEERAETKNGSGRFDKEAYEIFSVLAAEEARALNVNYIGSEAILLAILKQESACAKYVFSSGIRYEPVLKAVREAIANKGRKS